MASKRSKAKIYTYKISAVLDFYHVADLQVCDTISETIICKVIDKKVKERSVLDLYTSISQNEVLFPLILDYLPSHVEENIEGVFAE